MAIRDIGTIGHYTGKVQTLESGRIFAYVRGVTGGIVYRSQEFDDVDKASEWTANQLLDITEPNLANTAHTHSGETWECNRCGEAGGTFCWGCVALHNYSIHGVGRDKPTPIKPDACMNCGSAINLHVTLDGLECWECINK